MQIDKKFERKHIEVQKSNVTHLLIFSSGLSHYLHFINVNLTDNICEWWTNKKTGRGYAIF